MRILDGNTKHLKLKCLKLMIVNFKMRLNLDVTCEHSAPVKTHKQSYSLPFLFSAWDAAAMIRHSSYHYIDHPNRLKQLNINTCSTQKLTHVE